MKKTPLLFYASRTDGLGERLRAILNAHALAAHFGGRFGFHWGEMTKGTELDHHSVAPVSETFSPDFIAAHHLDDGQMAGVQTARLETAMAAQAVTGTFPPEVEAIEAAQFDLTFQGVVFPPGTDRAALLRKAWDDLQFAPMLEAARHLATTIPFPAQATAIHLRAGDIVYGHHRLSDRFHYKVCSYPIVEEIIRTQIDAGFTPVLFGQDLALCRYLRDRHGAVLASDLGVGRDFDKTQQAIFDIVLMSRCGRIVSEESGFAVLASWIAGVERSVPLAEVHPQQKVALIEAAVFAANAGKDVPALQRAFACRNAFVLSGLHFPTEPGFQRLLDEARKLDPENDFYHFVQAVASYAAGDAKTGEEITRTLLSGKKRFLYPLLQKQIGATGYEVDPYLPVLTQQADLGFAMAALFVSRAYGYQGDTAKAAHYATLSRTLDPAAFDPAGRLARPRSPSGGPPRAKSDPGGTLGAVLAYLLERTGIRPRSK